MLASHKVHDWKVLPLHVDSGGGMGRLHVLQPLLGRCDEWHVLIASRRRLGSVGSFEIVVERGNLCLLDILQSQQFVFGLKSKRSRV